MRKTRYASLLALALVGTLGAAPRTARASLLELWGDAGLGTLQYGGSITGSGGDYYKANSGLASAFSAGVHILFIDGYISEQLAMGDLSSKMFKVGLGLGTTIDVSVVKIFFSLGGGYGNLTWDDKYKTSLQAASLLADPTAKPPEPDATIWFGELRLGAEYKFYEIGPFGVGLGAWGNVGIHYQPDSLKITPPSAGLMGTMPMVTAPSAAATSGIDWSMFGGLRAHLAL